MWVILSGLIGIITRGSLKTQVIQIISDEVLRYTSPPPSTTTTTPPSHSLKKCSIPLFPRSSSPLDLCAFAFTFAFISV